MESKLFSDIVEGLKEAAEFEKGAARCICSITLDDGQIVRFEEPMTKDELDKKVKELRGEA